MSHPSKSPNQPKSSSSRASVCPPTARSVSLMTADALTDPNQIPTALSNSVNTAIGATPSDFDTSSGLSDTSAGSSRDNSKGSDPKTAKSPTSPEMLMQHLKKGNVFGRQSQSQATNGPQSVTNITFSSNNTNISTASELGSLKLEEKPLDDSSKSGKSGKSGKSASTARSTKTANSRNSAANESAGIMGKSAAKRAAKSASRKARRAAKNAEPQQSTKTGNRSRFSKKMGTGASANAFSTTGSTASSASRASRKKSPKQKMKALKTQEQDVSGKSAKSQKSIKSESDSVDLSAKSAKSSKTIPRKPANNGEISKRNLEKSAKKSGQPVAAAAAFGKSGVVKKGDQMSQKSIRNNNDSVHLAGAKNPPNQSSAAQRNGVSTSRKPHPKQQQQTAYNFPGTGRCTRSMNTVAPVASPVPLDASHCVYDVANLGSAQRRVPPAPPVPSSQISEKPKPKSLFGAKKAAVIPSAPPRSSISSSSAIDKSDKSDKPLGNKIVVIGTTQDGKTTVQMTIDMQVIAGEALGGGTGPVELVPKKILVRGQEIAVEGGKQSKM